MKIEIERVEDGRLRRQRWVFVATIGSSDVAKLTLVLWETQERASTRHKWRAVKPEYAPGYVNDHYKSRTSDGHHSWGYCRPAALVPMPNHVVIEAKQLLLQNLVVVGPQNPTKRK